MSEAEPGAHRTSSVQQAGNVNIRCPVDPRNNALRHRPPHLIDPEVRRRQALVLVAHCKALEARGPIASHSAGPPGPAALLLALEGQASVAVTRRLPATHQHPHRHRHDQEWINERQKARVDVPEQPGLSGASTHSCRYTRCRLTLGSGGARAAYEDRQTGDGHSAEPVDHPADQSSATATPVWQAPNPRARTNRPGSRQSM